MPDIIHLLPDTVANQIAAGEVIQRPSSVVKELVENAVDAGATMVQIFIEQAGKTLIQVIDDGQGMSSTDARLAFERHATSKISKAADLFSLRTMGFRGEALPSIAAVAQVELRTRTEADELGTCLLIEGGKVRSSTPVSAARGANFAVRNLFFNIPARRKFLKSDLTEMGAILTEFERLALAHPDVAFRLHRDGTLLNDLPAGSFRQRVTGLFGHRMDKQLLPVNVETDVVKINGFVGQPESARRKRAQQFFFVNGRYMRHPYFARAVQTAYERLVAEGTQVPFFLCFEVDPGTIDVNIHPTKTEIKFQDEQTIWQILLAAIREALGKFGGVPSIDFDTANAPNIPLFIPQVATTRTPGSYVPAPSVKTDDSYNPFLPPESEGTSYSRPAGSASSDIPASPFSQNQSTEVSGAFSPEDTSSQAPSIAHCFQHHGRFIVTSISGGLILVDQHRAHMRILYDRYIRSLSENPAPSQGLLFPQAVSLSPSEVVVLYQLSQNLSSLGFDLHKESTNICTIKGIPAGTEGLDPEMLLRAIIDEAAAGNDQASSEVNHRIALALSKRAAIPVGQELSIDEMSAICEQLFAGTSPNYAPDGSPIVLQIDEAQINQFFN